MYKFITSKAYFYIIKMPSALKCHKIQNKLQYLFFFDECPFEL